MAGFKCKGCGSEGFAPSMLGLDYCTFCDGTEGGHPPEQENIDLAQGRGNGGLYAALMGDEFFYAAIEAADPDTVGTGCSHCGCYHIARLSKGYQYGPALCPECGSKRGWSESPALSGGPASIQWDEREMEGGEIIVAALFWGCGSRMITPHHWALILEGAEQ